MRKKELLGFLLLIIGACGIYFSAKQSPTQFEYLTASRDISPGEVVATQDFTRASMSLFGAAPRYVSADIKLAGHRSLRTIARGEIVPRDALTSMIEIEHRHLLTFTVAKSSLPHDLKVGDLIDIYFFSIPNGAAVDEEIQLLKIVPKIRVYGLATDENQIDGQVNISALFEASDSGEYMTLIATARIAVTQRFDDVG